MGKRAEGKLKTKYPDGLEGRVSEVFLTRGKINGSFTNALFRGYAPRRALEILNPDKEIYEVVYQAWLEPHRDFVLSLFEQHPDPELRNQTLWVGQRIRILEFSCVAHPLHRFVIGANVEVYPSKVMRLSDTATGGYAPTSDPVSNLGLILLAEGE